MSIPVKRIAINFGGGFVPGLNAVITGTVLAAHELGWEVVGIRDGFDGLLAPERYADGGLLTLTPQMVENLSAGGSAILGNATRTDPFRVRQVNAENQVEEVDRSGQLIAKIAAEKIDAVISVVGPRALSILFRLHRQGLRTVCVPTSVENDVAATQLSFGFNSALSFAVDMLERVRQAAQSAQKIGVVEVLGEHAGWLALQAGIAVCADAVLIPEIPYDLEKVAAKLREKISAGRTSGLVVVAEGAVPRGGEQPPAETLAPESLRASLSPGATGPGGSHVIEGSGPRGSGGGSSPSAADRPDDLSARPGPVGQGRAAYGRGSATGTRLRRRGGARAAWKSKRRDGGLSAARFEIRTPERGDQQGAHRARQQRIRPDRPVARHRPG